MNAFLETVTELRRTHSALGRLIQIQNLSYDGRIYPRFSALNSPTGRIVSYNLDVLCFENGLVFEDPIGNGGCGLCSLNLTNFASHRACEMHSLEFALEVVAKLENKIVVGVMDKMSANGLVDVKFSDEGLLVEVSAENLWILPQTVRVCDPPFRTPCSHQEERIITVSPRDFVVPEDEHLIMAIDYKQMEVFIIRYW